MTNKLDAFLYNSNAKEQVLKLVDKLRYGNDTEKPILLYGSSPNMDVFSNFMSSTFDKRLKIGDGDLLNKPGDLSGILSSLEPYDILIINNIEFMPEEVKEYLYRAVDEGRIEIMIDSGPSARSIYIDLNPFTLIGTTKDIDLLSEDLKDIFKNTIYVDYAIHQIDSVQEAANDVCSQEKNNPFDNFISEIKIPIGLWSSGFHEFTFNAISHPHAFILGQSGSGKSVLLHSIITSMILRYSPEDLQMYLLDFKMGGVEFNRYKSVKHIKALLVDNSDIQITLEILRDIESQMKQRGKMLRESGVSSISDYNNIHNQDRMPSIIIAVDECHMLFSNQNSSNHGVQAEISRIISMISKEGRSQGVHLLLATQTLAGTEISVDVMNNITDHYLLKCSPSDSERMVSGSSQTTTLQSTGQVYYHHTDNQCQFKSFYHSNDELATIISTANQKADTHKSNGQFYFSGAQIFDINTSVKEYLATKGRKNIVAAPGCAISLDETPISIILKNDFSENILLFGINDQEQVTRVTMDILVSLAISNAKKELGYRFIVLDCLNQDDGDYANVLDGMENCSLCSIVSGKKRGVVLKQLVDDISSEDVQPTILVVFGQEKFRELKLDMTLPADDDFSIGGELMTGMEGLEFSNSGNSGVKTYKDALKFILERGPEVGVHTILQIDKPDKLLFEEYTVTAKDVFSKFKHLVMLRSDENAATRFIDNQIKLEVLSGDNDRLRAYYYSDEEDKYTLFTPYSMPTLETLSLLK